MLSGFFVASVIARRVKRLASGAEEMAAGSFDVSVDTSGRDEIGDLARALDSMRASLEESFGVLTADRDKLTAIFDGLTDAVMVVDDDGAIRFSNSAAARLVDSDGHAPEAMVPQLRRASAVGFSAHPALRIGDRAYAIQARDLPEEGAVLAVVRDRTDEMRREFAERDFVSNAAHELRNPLAGISGAIEVLQTGAKDDPEAREHFLERLSQDAERMSRLTESLLILARVEALGAGEEDVVDVAAAASDVAAAVEAPPGIELHVEIEPNLAAKGDPTLLRQVLIGLLTNAYQEHAHPRRRYRSRPPRRRDGGRIGSDGHRHRDPRCRDREGLRALLPALRVPPPGGLRPRPGDRPPDGQCDGRADRSVFGRGPGQHLLGAAPGRTTQPNPGRMSRSEPHR